MALHLSLPACTHPLRSMKPPSVNPALCQIMRSQQTVLRPSGTVNISCIIHDLLERPSAVAASVMSLAKARIATNQQLGWVVAQLQALEAKREDAAQQAQMKTLLGNLNKELPTINEDNRSTAALTTAVKELTGEVRGMSTYLYASMGAEQCACLFCPQCVKCDVCYEFHTSHS